MLALFRLKNPNLEYQYLYFAKFTHKATYYLSMLFFKTSIPLSINFNKLSVTGITNMFLSKFPAISGYVDLTNSSNSFCFIQSTLSVRFLIKEGSSEHLITFLSNLDCKATSISILIVSAWNTDNACIFGNDPTTCCGMDLHHTCPMSFR